MSEENVQPNKEEVIALQQTMTELFTAKKDQMEEYLVDLFEKNEKLFKSMEKADNAEEVMGMYITGKLTSDVFTEAIAKLHEDNKSHIKLEITTSMEKHIEYLLERIKTTLKDKTSSIQTQFLTRLSALDILPATVYQEVNVAVLPEGAFAGYQTMKNYQDMEAFENAYRDVFKEASKEVMVKDLREKNTEGLNLELFAENFLNETLKSQHGEIRPTVFTMNQLVEALQYSDEIMLDGKKLKASTIEKRLKDKVNEVNHVKEVSFDDLKTSVFDKIKDKRNLAEASARKLKN